MTQVSVVIPTRNRVELLRRAIDSVRKQRDSEPEIIVVDDGDLENESLAEELFQKKISYIYSGGNRGGGYSRNLGAEHARGEFIAFLDDDDEWEESKLSEQLLAINRTDSGLCYTGISVVNESGREGRYIFRKPGSDPFKAIMKKNFIGTTSSVMLRRETFEQTGGFDPSLRALQDYDLYIRILKNSRITGIDKPLTIYHDHGLTDKVSGSRKNYIQAAAHLHEKYRSERYYSLLKLSLLKIGFMKMVRSKQFLKETLKSTL